MTFSLSNVFMGVSVARFRRTVAAAGVADSAYLLLVAVCVVAILATVFAIVSFRSPLSRVSKAIELPPLLFVAGFVLFDAVLGAELLTGNHLLAWFYAARVVTWAGAGVCVLSGALAVRGARIRRAETGTARPFVVLAIVNAAAAVALFIVYRGFWNVANRGS
jgi:hypothetical protein